jgi:hypothetical protein
MPIMSNYVLPPMSNILEMQRRFWSALQTQNEAELELVLAENYRCISPDQPDQNRAEFIQTLTSFPFMVEAVTCENLQINVFGDIAILTGVQTAQMSMSDGERFADKIAITNVFNCLANEWQMVLSHAVTLPATSS